MNVERRIVKTKLACIGFIIREGSSKEKSPLFCFHASPRSFDEFIDAFPFLSEDGQRTVVALDNPGYGISENPKASCGYNEISDAFLEVADSLQIDKFIVVGNLMGNYVSVALASRYPDRILAVIAVNLYYFPYDQDKAESSAEPNKAIEDSWKLKEDGSHLVEIHDSRKDWLPEDLNVRVVQTELTYKVNRRARYAKGIAIEDFPAFDFESAAKKLHCPVLCLKGEAFVKFFDTIGYNGTKVFDAGCALFSNASIKSIHGPTSTLNVINQEPEAFAAICNQFMNSLQL